MTIFLWWNRSENLLCLRHSTLLCLARLDYLISENLLYLRHSSHKGTAAHLHALKLSQSRRCLTNALESQLQDSSEMSSIQ